MSGTNKPYYRPPMGGPSPEYNVQWANRMTDSLNIAMQKLNNTAELTLAAGAASTPMVDARLSAFTQLTFMAETANAAAIAGSIWVDAQGKGTATIHHANTANTDQDFRIGIMG